MKIGHHSIKKINLCVIDIIHLFDMALGNCCTYVLSSYTVGVVIRREKGKKTVNSQFYNIPRIEDKTCNPPPL